MAPRRAGNGQCHRHQELREAQVPAGAQAHPHPSTSLEAKSMALNYI